MTQPSEHTSQERGLPAANAIISDVVEVGRNFLPGPVPDADDMWANLSLPILMGTLDHEEVALVLSALPKGAERVYLSPMDKGLSGAKVLSIRYNIAGRRVGKMFVLKIGDNLKIDREVSAIERLVLPDVYGVVRPVHRRGPKKSMLVQELAGLAAHSQLRSLREHVREGNDPAPVIRRLLFERLGNWYQPRSQTTHTWSFGGLFRWYLKKTGDTIFAPPSWGNVEAWLNDLTGVSHREVQAAANDISQQSVTSWQTIVHGDLHCQNVLIDEHGEPWPIDFAWCHENSSPLLDVVMLECSLKFLVIPGRADIRQLLNIEQQLAVANAPSVSVKDIPYADDIARVLSGLWATREFATSTLGIPFDDYRKGLFLMTWCLRDHPGLNQPYVLSSLAVIAKALGYTS